jgi:hypothetical protein
VSTFKLVLIASDERKVPTETSEHEAKRTWGSVPKHHNVKPSTPPQPPSRGAVLVPLLLQVCANLVCKLGWKRPAANSGGVCLHYSNHAIQLARRDAVVSLVVAVRMITNRAHVLNCAKVKYPSPVQTPPTEVFDEVTKG